MQNHEECDRCEGSGVDPSQPFASIQFDLADAHAEPDARTEPDVRVCIECFGDGFVEVFEFTAAEHLSAA